MSPKLGRLGVGAVYWPSLHNLFEDHPDLIQVAEAEPSSFWIKAPGPAGALRSSLDVLERLAELPQAKLLHGVGYPVGGTRCDQSEPVAELRRWAQRLGVAWTSEHLSFNETDAGAAGFLLPPCQSDSGVAVAAANIRCRAALLDTPFAYETGDNYLPRQDGEMADGAFFAAVAEAADCRILLDLHNLWANERNGRGRVLDVIAALPLERVCEIHLAGGLEKDGFWLDAHSGPVPPELLALAAEIMPDLPAVGAILFELAPQHLGNVDRAGFLRQIEALHRLWERRGKAALPETRGPASFGRDINPAAWEACLVQALAAPPAESDPPAIGLYRSLVASFRNGALADLLPHSLNLIAIGRGQARLEAILADYGDSTPPQLYPAHEALQFADWLAANPVDLPYLHDMLTFESAIVRFASDGRGGEVVLEHDPSIIAAAVAAGRSPTQVPAGDYRLVIGATAQA